MSVLSKQVSYFPNINATSSGVKMDLLRILQSDKHKESILKLRSSPIEIQKQLKLQLPCYTVSGLFSRRNKEGLLQHSGLACVDLDNADAYELIPLLSELKKIPSIAYAGLSCRGRRLFCIVPFLHPDKYERYYERLILSFIDIGLPMGDSCHRQISQPRFVSWNEDATQFFNHNARQYDVLPPEKTYITLNRSHQNIESSVNPINAFQWCEDQVNKSHSFTKGKRHDYILHLARYANLKGIPEKDTLDGCKKFIQKDFPATEIKNIVTHIYSTQIESHNKLPFQHKSDHPSHADRSSAKIERDTNQHKPGKSAIITDHISIESLPPNEKIIDKKAFIGKSGKFFIPNPVDENRYAVYESPQVYNSRIHAPIYVSHEEAFADFSQWIQVDPNMLLAIIPQFDEEND